jgi:pimeloyl-ACP methyl ester carboxylesterase
MNQVISKDGIPIAFDQSGEGPSLILVGGASADRSENLPLAAFLARRFTVFNYDRRGRGDSGDRTPYAVAREIEDIEALINKAGGTAFVLGFSSGAALALQAAVHNPQIKKLALYEPPFIVDDSQPRPPADLAEHYNKLIAAGKPGEAVEYFMIKVVGLPAEFTAQARNSPWWPAQEALAHTLVYDAIVMGDWSLPVETAKSIRIPALVIAGEASFPFMRATAQALAGVLPDGQYCGLADQTHDIDPQVLAPVIEKFFLN